MPYEKDPKKMDQGTVRKIANYLFDDKGLDEHEYMDMRTDISNTDLFKALTYYRILGHQFKSKTAIAIADIVERLSISVKRGGRHEGVTTLLQQFPKVESLKTGISNLLEKELGS